MPRKDTNERASSLELFRQYLSATDTCDICGARLTENYRDDDHHVVVVAIEWRGEIPALLARRAICDLCVSEVEQFTLPNSLCRITGQVPEAVRRKEHKKDHLDARRESRHAARTIEAERARLELAWERAHGPSARAKISKEIDALVTKTVGIDTIGHEFESIDADRRAPDENSIAAPPDRNDLRTVVRRFLQSPYRGKLTRKLQDTAQLYATGLSEVEISHRIKLSQATVSRQIQTIVQVARQRR